MAAPDPVDTAPKTPFEVLDAALKAAFEVHARRADNFVVARLSDARSHALGGMLPLATQRLNDLHHGLMGMHGGGIVGDSRAAFYRDAFDQPYDPDIHDPDRRYPTAEGMAAARTAPIGGIDAHRELGRLIEQARTGLVVATAAAGLIGDPGTRVAAIDAWHGRHSAAIRSWARGALSDSQVGILNACGLLRMRPEFRED